jgi:hypothetical protein
MWLRLAGRSERPRVPAVVMLIFGGWVPQDLRRTSAVYWRARPPREGWLLSDEAMTRAGEAGIGANATDAIHPGVVDSLDAVPEGRRVQLADWDELRHE